MPIGQQHARTPEDCGQEQDQNPPQVDTGDVDLSAIPPTHDGAKSPEIGGDYDPGPQEDQARRHIAYRLIGLLWLVVAARFMLVSFGTIKVSEIKELAVVLGPIVTLVSAATGFYYGTKSKS